MFTKKSYSLVFEECSFFHLRISKGWLALSYKASPKILQITDFNSIEKIEDYAFTGEVFTATEDLILQKMKLQSLSRHTFAGLTELKKLQITEMHLTSVDRFILIAMPRLTTFALEQITGNSLDLSNITGVLDLDKLLSVSLRDNNFRSSINQQSFAGLRNVKSIYLMNSNIFTIGEKTFDVMENSIEFIDLRRNFLRNLPANLFGEIAYRGNVAIYLSENPWECDCSLIDLKQTLNQFKRTFSDFDRIKCATPELNSGQVVGHSNFCLRPTESPPLIDEFLEVDCKECGKTILLPKKQFKFTAFGDPRTNTITIQIDPVRSDLFLLLTRFPSDHLGNLFEARRTSICMTQLKQRMRISIEREHDNKDNYEICIFSRRLSTKSPFDCLNLRFLPVERSGNSIIGNESPDTLFTFAAVGVICCVIFFSISLGVIIAFVVFRCSKKYRKNSSVNQSSEFRRSSSMSRCSDKTYDSLRVALPLDAITWRLEIDRSKLATRNAAIYSYSYENTPPLPQRQLRKRSNCSN